MDKWDEIIHRIQQGILAEEPEAAATAGLQLFAEFGRGIEQIGADLDRVATALENAFEPVNVESPPAPLDL